ncbi:hypothetical protein ACTMTJ_14140 [Phytohabitans sp. LJ34]|uniref:hypothetical protein n=1 Tax=Phytohabitans sp. LJ34 TaxID=3452217 RepID=UPI003F8CB96B
MDITRLGRAATSTLIAGALLHLAVGVAQFVNPVDPEHPGLAFTIATTTSHLLVLTGVLALAASGAAGSGRLPRIGLPLAGLGWALIAAAELTVGVDFTVAKAMFGAGDPLIGLGMTLTGVEVLRTGRWHGWRRFAPLACGLYPFAVELPAFAVFGMPNTPAITGIGLVWLTLGVALRLEVPAESPARPRAAATRGTTGADYR